MMVTNLIGNPRATVALTPGEYVPISTIGRTAGVQYHMSVYATVSGDGEFSLVGVAGKFSKSQRISWTLTAANSSPMSLLLKVVSGSPKVSVTGMLCLREDEYQANRQLIDSIAYFDGDTMPLA